MEEKQTQFKECFLFPSLSQFCTHSHIPNASNPVSCVPSATKHNVTQCVKSFLSRFRNKRQQKQQHPMPQILFLAFRDKKEQHPIRQFSRLQVAVTPSVHTFSLVLVHNFYFIFIFSLHFQEHKPLQQNKFILLVQGSQILCVTNLKHVCICICRHAHPPNISW